MIQYQTSESRKKKECCVKKKIQKTKTDDYLEELKTHTFQQEYCVREDTNY